MTTKKDNAINSVMKDFEEFANLVLHQLDSTVQTLLKHVANLGGAHDCCPPRALADVPHSLKKHSQYDQVVCQVPITWQ